MLHLIIAEHTNVSVEIVGNGQRAMVSIPVVKFLEPLTGRCIGSMAWRTGVATAMRGHFPNWPEEVFDDTVAAVVASHTNPLQQMNWGKG